ncbi:MAG: TonB family protein [Candidatus Acididesulfobacter diazotrophicus]|uniref:TonB family protein n=1 Tax=Candidatus Acididesulfobacter diazotrophicus TaxID=2597226 RepID=A0A519BPG6_9DELT|nr:MAG: TonB family protein [Candidatus Acididesulfobacter diazotrophicus]
MYNDNKAKGVGKYYIVSFLFHVILIGLLILISMKFKSKIQSLGSKVVVSVVSAVPGPLASTKTLTHAIKKNTVKKHVAVKPAVTPIVINNEHNKAIPKKTITPAPNKQIIPVAKSKSSMIYPKKAVHKIKIVKPHQITPSKPAIVPQQQVASSVYSHLKLKSAYSKLQSSLIAGNIHKFSGYISKITYIIISNFNIPLSQYLHFKSIIAFKITKSGLVYNVRLVKSSGSSYFDAQSIAAVKSSAPLPSPPRGFMAYMNSENDNNGVLAIFYPKEILKSE